MRHDNVLPSLIRVERGRATAEELAALTVLLLARRDADAPAEGDDTRATAGTPWWHRGDAYRAPDSWR
ncbi:acyl-CoA carboxylase epsilon subunit [Streptomyces sp. NPDC057694]|uniref:acyl-CoA carboxylase epsilon subunit n=1 Tax=Streptomyces sp. NPDC057694 TaxID=3346216 RepID=UPI00367AFDD3